MELLFKDSLAPEDKALFYLLINFLKHYVFVFLYADTNMFIIGNAIDLLKKSIGYRYYYYYYYCIENGSHSQLPPTTQY